jgi:glutathione S-transferase
LAIENRLARAPVSLYAWAMKLYRFRYSPYARKVQMLLDLLGAKYELIEVDYCDRNALAELTGGYIYVPVLVDDDGRVITESRDICAHLLTGPDAAKLVPSPWEGPIWAYADFSDGPLEDVLFRIGSPAVRDAWPTPGERALYVLVKERKFGAGCVTAWERERDALIARARTLLVPSLQTLAVQPFLFGDSPTLADAALYGQCAMLEAAGTELLATVGEALPGYARRVEYAARG